MNVPYLDLRAQNDSIRAELDAAIKEVIDTSSFILGKHIDDLEKNFAAYCNAKHAVAVNSGTAALHLILLSLGIKAGDEVITVPNTFIATAEAISHCGATPVFVDIDERSYTMDPTLIEKKITARTKAIIPVHLYGNPADMDKINVIAKKHGLFVIEDACQAHGAKYKNRSVATLGIAGAFSFYPGKNMGALGEGGIIVTNDEELAKKCRLYRAHGEYPKNTHNVIGYNYRLEGLQGAVLNVKLRHLDSWNEARRKNAKVYDRLLKDVVITPEISQDNQSVFHIYAIRIKDRDKLKEFLSSKGISTGVHYEKPIHVQKAYSSLNYKEGDFPIAEKVMKEELSLPMFPELTEEQIAYVCESIKEFTRL